MERVSFKAEADTIQSVLLPVPELELELAPGLVPLAPPILVEHGGPPPLVGHSPASSKAVIVVLALGPRRRRRTTTHHELEAHRVFHLLWRKLWPLQ